MCTVSKFSIKTDLHIFKNINDTSLSLMISVTFVPLYRINIKNDYNTITKPLFLIMFPYL